MTYEQAYIQASGHFLEQRFPTTVFTWSDDRVSEWLTDHAWVVMENQPHDLVLDAIDTLARDFVYQIQQQQPYDNQHQTV
ncbi:MAG: hypothetical protein ACPH5P_00295 [Akkermansiaceae bacterium]